MADAPGGVGDRQVGGSHYTEVKIQYWDVVDAWGLDEDHYRATALKYLYRAGRKGSYAEDLKKAIHYLEKAIEREGQRDAGDR